MKVPLLGTVLAVPSIYTGLQVALGARRVRHTLIHQHVRPRAGLRILDLGCGPADILEDLPEDSHYVGADTEASYIQKCRDRWGSRGEFIHLPVTELRPERFSGFDVVLSLGVLHHLTTEEARSVFAIAHHALVPGGRVVTFDPCYTPGQNPLARVLFSMDRGQHVRWLEGYLDLIPKEQFEVKHALYHGLLRVPYTHLIMECQRK